MLVRYKKGDITSHFKLTQELFAEGLLSSVVIGLKQIDNSLSDLNPVFGSLSRYELVLVCGNHFIAFVFFLGAVYEADSICLRHDTRLLFQGSVLFII